MTLKRLLYAIAGIGSIGSAAAGFWYNSVVLSSFFRGAFQPDPETPYFLHAYIVMSAICWACFALLLICGIQFLRMKTKLVNAFMGLLLFEVLYFFAVGVLWMLPEGVGMSIAAATGVANGGLVFQAFVLFPLWAPILLMVAGRIPDRSNQSASSIHDGP